MKLPAPTWKQADQTDAIFCYVLTAPPYTGLDYREDKGKETRGKSYNLALMIEMNLRIAANGVTLQQYLTRTIWKRRRRKWSGQSGTQGR